MRCLKKRVTAREWQDLVLSALPCRPSTVAGLLKTAREHGVVGRPSDLRRSLRTLLIQGQVDVTCPCQDPAGGYHPEACVAASLWSLRVST